MLIALWRKVINDPSWRLMITCLPRSPSMDLVSRLCWPFSLNLKCFSSVCFPNNAFHPESIFKWVNIACKLFLPRNLVKPNFQEWINGFSKLHHLESKWNKLFIWMEFSFPVESTNWTIFSRSGRQIALLWNVKRGKQAQTVPNRSQNAEEDPFISFLTNLPMLSLLLKFYNLSVWVIGGL